MLYGGGEVGDEAGCKVGAGVEETDDELLVTVSCNITSLASKDHVDISYTLSVEFPEEAPSVS